MIPRSSAARIASLASQFPVVLITGPRQAGKTTVVRNLYPDLPYVNLERPDILSLALDDPMGFLKRYAGQAVIFDEAQRWPEQMRVHPLRGAFHETMVVGDIIKKSLYDSPPTEWYFWSAAQGPEVDLIRKQGTTIQAIEIKAAETFKPAHIKQLLSFADTAGLPPGALELRYGGADSFEHQGVRIRPWWV